MLLRVTPAIPCPLHSRVDQLEPFLFSSGVWRSRQGEHLPAPVIANDRHDRLATGPPDVTIGSRDIWVGGHQALLHSEDEIVCGMQGRGRHRRVAAAKADLERANRLAQRFRRLGVVVETQGFDVIQETIRLREK
jgi:hypothetical protein